jgi:Raf kinase inhibitor-like YbhB/YbcL family protein
MIKILIAALLTSTSLYGFATESFSIQSKSIIDGRFEKIHACGRHGGQEQSPSIHILNTPVESKYFAIIVDDPDAQSVAGRTWVHWNVFNVPSSITNINAGKTPEGEEKSSSSQSGYEGMCPPNGTHTYNIAVFAMKEKIDAGGIFGISPITIEQFSRKFKNTIIEQALIQGKF